ncbi:hypothetical protein MNBD_GAMMA15-2467 [hydrothermal vent metagenome]|uniref:PEP-CTERM protein-sorting domain-containing protein n=1 Tax=hydrothermal vent metagenome TaxID=652676 RepID=A0A3B0Z4Z2_9ZZZZ
MRLHFSALVGLLLLSASASASNYNIFDITQSEWSWSYAYDINDAGQIVGEAQNSSFFYDPIGGTRWIVFASGDSSLTGINELGVAVGFAPEEPYRNFTVEYDTTPELILSASSSVFSSISDSGEIFSSSRGAGYSGPADLLALLSPAPGWSNLVPTSINNSGQIVGLGTLLSSGRTQAFLMTPVPLPPTLYLFGIGLVGLVKLARR